MGFLRRPVAKEEGQLRACPMGQDKAEDEKP